MKELTVRRNDAGQRLDRFVGKAVPLLPETLLQKTKDNVAQSSLSSREERQKNVVGAYVAVNEDKIKGQRILLIDDILTTGATLREAARVLREAGAEKVICATLAAADGD